MNQKDFFEIYNDRTVSARCYENKCANAVRRRTMMNREHPERECVTCGEKGHWYIDCPKFDFWGSVWNAFDLGKKPWSHLSEDKEPK